MLTIPGRCTAHRTFSNSARWTRTLNQERHKVASRRHGLVSVLSYGEHQARHDLESIIDDNCCLAMLALAKSSKDREARPRNNAVGHKSLHIRPSSFTAFSGGMRLATPRWLLSSTNSISGIMDCALRICWRLLKPTMISYSCESRPFCSAVYGCRALGPCKGLYRKAKPYEASYPQFGVAGRHSFSQLPASIKSRS